MSKNYQEASAGNVRQDPYSNFWTSNDDHSTPTEPGYSEDLEDDTRASYQEARGRAEEREELERARPDLENLRAAFGSVPTALQVNRTLKETYRRDPQAGREMHRRAYLQTLPLNGVPKKWEMQAPPDDYTESARDDHHLRQSVIAAMKTAADEKQYEAELAAAGPWLALEKMEHGNLTTPLMVYSAADQAMQIDPHAASRRLSYLTGAPTSEAHANEQIAQVQYQQHAGELGQWVGQVAASGALPGFEHPVVEDAVVKCIHYMNQNNMRTGDYAADLQTAYGGAIALLQQEYAQQQQQQQQREAVERARHASRSLSGNSIASDDFTPAARTFAEGSVEADVARAYRSQFV